ncbi:MAG UNVERIFIED_CONTAM: DUF3387 domain-containing protein [Microcystis novacekii LVE1205-3]|jgi:type I restriction enzyme R subunit
MELQQVVDETIIVEKSIAYDQDGVYVDLSKLDFAKLRAAFAKTEKKNTVVFDLQRAVAQKLKRMLQQNPLRMEFYERYREIVEDYNKGKDLEDTIRAFDKLYEFVERLNAEESRAMRENLDEETLAVFDLLRSGKTLTGDELKEVKKVAADTLSRLKAEKLSIQRWRV